MQVYFRLAALFMSFFTAIPISRPAWASEAAPELDEKTLENPTTITVASKKPLTVRDSPGIVTIVTQEEIIHSGARDIIDVLRMVPGIDFATDYNGTVAAAIRGLWGLEGKVLIMLDGQPLNDLYYDSALFGNRFPLDQIDQIQIIRGPGSAIYGNQAEYAVLNIVTLTGRQLDGVHANVVYGRFSGATSQDNFTLAYGKKFGSDPGDLDLSIKTYFGHTQRSDRDRLYPDGIVLNMYDAYGTTPQHVNLGATFKGLALRAVVDRVLQKAQDYSDPYSFPSLNGALNRPTEFGYFNYLADIKYDWKILSNLTFSPEYRFQSTATYNNSDLTVTDTNGNPTNQIIPFDTFVNRQKVSLPLIYDPLSNLNLVGGIEGYSDMGGSGGISGYYSPTNYNMTSATNSVIAKSVYYNNYSLFAQGIYSTPYGNLTLGGRFEMHNVYGPSLIPRIGYTNALASWHFKFLFNRAFRYPSVGNINDAAFGGNTLQPERTQAYELEIGYQVNKWNSLTLNLFNMAVDKPIVYFPKTQAYGNFDQTGSRGLEAQYKATGVWGYSTLSYSYYNANALNEVSKFKVTQDSTQLSGFAPHKVSWNTSYRFLKNFQVNPQFIWLSQRYTFSNPLDANGNLTTQPMDPTLLINLFVTYEDAFIRNLTLGAGVFDLLGSNYSYGTAYDLGRNPLPGPSREYVVRANYRLPL